MSGVSWTPAQAQAVETPGSIAIAAGAGSGKTRVLTARVVRALDRGVRPQEIVVVTFTVAAARELQTRIRGAVQREVDAAADGRWTQIQTELPLMTITTIDGLCGRVAREHPALSGVGFGIEVLEPADAQLWERGQRARILAELPAELLARVPSRLRAAALQQLGEWGGALGTNAASSATAGALVNMVQHVQAQLEAWRLEDAVATYRDLEAAAHRAVQHEEVRAYYAQRWTHLLVDELQDTSLRQWAVLGALCGERTVLTVVGDEQQSLYGFRGAEPQVFRAARDVVRARGGRSLGMHTSFRSVPALVDTVNATCGRLMSAPGHAVPVVPPFTPLEAARARRVGDEPVTDLQVVQGGDSARRALSLGRVLAARLQELLGHPVYDREWEDHRPARWGDMALLVRARTHLAHYKRALHEAGIPYEVHGGRGLYGRPEIVDAIMLLRAVADPADDLALIATLRGPFALLSDVQVSALARAREPGASVWSALQQSTDPACQVVSKQLETWRAASGLQPAARVLERAQHEAGALAIHASAPDGAVRVANLRRLGALLRSWAQHGRADVRSAARYLTELQGVGAAQPEASTDRPDAVQVMTVHGAKGLEWPIVAYARDLAPRPDRDQVRVDPEVGLVLREDAAAWAAARERAAQRDRLEEQRVTYVALTRAADRLVVGLGAPDSRGPKAELQALQDAFPALVPRRTFAAGGVPAGRPLPLLDTPQGPVLRVTPGPEVALPGRLPVTSLALYARCPQAFSFRHLHGYLPLARPWSGDEPMTPEARHAGREIGDAVHQAIEKGWIEGMIHRRLRGLSPTGREEVARLVGQLQAPAFAELRDHAWQRERPVEVRVGSRTVYGVADAVDTAGDLVIDYKTDRIVAPQHHRLQLALYAHALGVTRAALVYLRQGHLHWFGTGELQEGVDEARDVIGRMEALEMAPTPSVAVCGPCAFRGVCGDAAWTDDAE